MSEIEWVLDGHANAVPHFFKLGERFFLPNTYDQVLVVKIVGVKTQKSKPQIEDRRAIGSEAGPYARQGGRVREVPRIPAINFVDACGLPRVVQLLKKQKM